MIQQLSIKGYGVYIQALGSLYRLSPELEQRVPKSLLFEEGQPLVMPQFGFCEVMAPQFREYDYLMKRIIFDVHPSHAPIDFILFHLTRTEYKAGEPRSLFDFYKAVRSKLTPIELTKSEEVAIPKL